jgi:3-phenylpropionate/trans-cinnamate dioxygenase ferredoxin reductase subunit
VADSRTVVIVGAGLAGAKAAETLREEGFEGRVVLVGEESRDPYERPPLSKSFLLGQSALEDAQVHPGAFYAAHDISLLRGVSATGLDVAAHRVTLDDGSALSYDRLLLATGAVPRRPPIEGIDLPGVHLLRTAADADALRSAIAAGGSVAIVGAGWIGCEVAAAARTLGAEVTLIERDDAPLGAVLGPELGGMFAELHRNRGVDVRTGAGVERFVGSAAVEGVALAGGTVVPAATVVVGVGIAPAVALAEAAGLLVDNGVVVDELLRTSADDVFAAGDVANARHPRYGRHVRVEHWANALHQGPAAARSMLGRGEPFARLPYFFSDQYDVGMEYAGLHSSSDRVVIEGGLDAAGLQALWLDREGHVTAGLHVNRWDEGIEPIKRLIESGAVAA